MTTLEEGELRFEFADLWRAERFEVYRRGFPPKGVSPVDFVAECDHEIVLVESRTHRQRRYQTKIATNS